MASPTFVLDGTHGYGTDTLTINGTAYLADDITVNRPKESAEQRTAAGAPQKWRSTEGFHTGSATLQIGSGTSGYPKHGDTFTNTFDDNYGSELFAVMEVTIGRNNSATDIRKVPITFRKVYNGSVTTVA